MLKIGWSRKDVSTNEPLPIPGQFFLRISEGVLDPILINVLTLENNGEYVIFVQIDAASVPAGILDSIKEKVSAQNPAIDTSKIIINATHTHCGPGLAENSDEWYMKCITDAPNDGVDIKLPGEYIEYFVAKAAEAVCESFVNKEEGSVAYGYGYAAVAQSRRVVFFDDLSKRPESANADSGQLVHGHAQMYGDTTDDMFSHYEAGTDALANYLFTFDKNDKLTGAVINIPCPSQNSELDSYLTADFWADVREQLRQRYGDIYILSQCAAAGDLSPRMLHYKEAQKRRFRLKYEGYKMPDLIKQTNEKYTRMDIAERIADSFDEVYKWASKEKFSDLPIAHSVKTIELSKRMITEDEYKFCLAESEKRIKQGFVTDGTPLEKFHANTSIVSSIRRYNGIIQRYETQNQAPKHPMEMHVVRIGNIAFATNQFELYMDFQHRIQGRSPFEQTFIVQLCGQPDGRGCGTYLATERGADNRGYSASMYCNIVSPEGGQELVEETLRELNKLFEN